MILAIPPEITRYIVEEFIPLHTLLKVSQISHSLRQTAQSAITRRYPSHIHATFPFFLEFSKHLRNICAHCLDDLRTFEHPVFATSWVCEKCITHGPHAVIRLSQARKLYHFPRAELKYFADNSTACVRRSVNYFAPVRKLDTWITFDEIRKLSYELYGTEEPLAVEIAKKANRSLGIRKRSMRCKLKREINKRLGDLGYHKQELVRFQKSHLWRRKFPRFEILLKGSPITNHELYFAECVTVLNEFRLDHTRFKQYETKLLRRLDELDISPFFKQKIRSCSKIVEINQFSISGGTRTSTSDSDKSIDEKISLLLSPFNYNTKYSIHDKFQIPLDWQSLFV
jgi:hypothetical protein